MFIRMSRISNTALTMARTVKFATATAMAYPRMVADQKRRIKPEPRECQLRRRLSTEQWRSAPSPLVRPTQLARYASAYG